ncbi:MAG: hypothetical protein LBM99_01250 [Bacillales bacterium]|jgi:ATP-dependent DNA helicase RecG|nr:hypothetical protein [Bacillales bacterium]
MLSEKQILEAQQLAVAEMKKTVNEKDGRVHPFVGAVLLFKDGTMIGAHRGEYDNGDHAEFTLLRKKCQTKVVEDTVIFATLEPCFQRHFPKVSCAQRIIDRRIKEVYIGIDDPDPSVSGRGKKLLEDSGIKIHYFNRKLQKEIFECNKEFLGDAILRSKIEKEKVEKIEYYGLDEIVSNFNIQDISSKAINLFLSKSKLKDEYNKDTIMEQFVKWGLVYKKDNQYEYTKSFIMLFAAKPSDYLNNVQFKLKFFEENSTLDLPLVLLPNEIEKYLNTKIPSIALRIKPELENRKMYPIEPLLEGCINAMVHRDYQIEGTNNQLTIDSKGITIKSPGSAVEPQTVTNLVTLNASSIVRNHKINFIFASMHYVENNNFGMDKMKNIPLNYEKPFPVYVYKTPYLELTFYFSKNELVDDKVAFYPTTYSVNEIAAIEYLKVAKQTNNSDLLKSLQLSNSKAVQRLLEKLVVNNVVEEFGNTKGRNYRLKML